MDRLNPDRTSSFGYPSVACDFSTAKRELEMMVGSEVNVILTKSFGSFEILRCNGTMSLPETVNWPDGGLRFVLDENNTAFVISEAEFTRAEHERGVREVRLSTLVKLTDGLGTDANTLLAGVKLH